MIKTFYFNDLRTCCYILYDEKGECAIIDPGCYKQSEKDRLVKFVETNSLQPRMILQTHGHFDHVMGNAFVTEKWGIPTYITPEDIPQMRRAKSYSSLYGFDFDEPSEDIIEIHDGDIIKVGEIELRVLFSPGHTPGGVIYYDEKGKYMFSGDTLFQGSIGRTDLPGGDYDALMHSLRYNVLTMPSDVIVYPGHGPVTDVGDELLKNPFLEPFLQL